MKKHFLLSLLTFSAIAVLAGCSTAKKELGLEKTSPDEFAVVKRAPLEMPPEFNLRPPMPGAPRPQEQATSEQAREAVLGKDDGAGDVSAPVTNKGEAALLQEANAGSNPNIRQVVDSESVKTDRKNQPVVKRLLNIGGKDKPAAKVVDPSAEAQRLKDNAAQGKPVTAGDTPGIDD